MATKDQDVLAEMQAQLDALRAERDALFAQSQSRYHVRKNMDTGTISIVGFNGKWPLTLYPEQVTTLDNLMPLLREAAKDQNLRAVAAVRREEKREAARIAAAITRNGSK